MKLTEGDVIVAKWSGGVCRLCGCLIADGDKIVAYDEMPPEGHIRTIKEHRCCREAADDPKPIGTRASDRYIPDSWE